MNNNIEKIDICSIICQSLATTSLIAELYNSNFFDSEFYKEMPLANEYKEIIRISGIGNPSMLQMMLYSLLVIPKEKLKLIADNALDNINDEIEKLVENENNLSTYKSDKKKVDYLRHIRNAVSHSNTKYFINNQICYVTFYDKDNRTNEKCSFNMKTENVGKLLEILQMLLKKEINNFKNIK